MSRRAEYEAMTEIELDNEAARRGRKLQAWGRRGEEGRHWYIDRDQTITNLLRDDEENPEQSSG